MQDLLNQLQALESELHHPGAECSRVRLEALLHPGFHEVGRSGRQYTREDVIGHLTSGAERTKVVASNYTATVLAEDCALLTYRSVQSDEGMALELSALRSSLWRRTEIGWQLFYHQGTPTDPTP
jgi:hypothetical protein